MTPYVACSNNGEIISCGIAQNEDLAKRAGDTVLFIDSDGIGPATHYVKNGALVEKLPKPSPHHAFNYATKTWALDTDAAWAWVRAERNRRLVASDWTQLPDVPATQKALWATYRQALRDVTAQPDPLSITWPSAPA